MAMLGFAPQPTQLSPNPSAHFRIHTTIAEFGYIPCRICASVSAPIRFNHPTVICMTHGGCDRGTKPGAIMNHSCDTAGTNGLHIACAHPSGRAHRHGCAVSYPYHPPEHHLPNVQCPRIAALDTY